MIDIKSMDLQELERFMEERGERAYRARQLYAWMHRKLAADFEQMTDLSAGLRASLQQECRIAAVSVRKELCSRKDGTRKYLMQLSDGNTVESVWMRYRHGNSACVSSQVGCRMGCRFCASTEGGLVRSLAVSEMLDQVYEIQRRIGERVSHVIIMGIGEPLDNFENVVRFIRMLSDENGLHISQRNITLSTCGLVPQIYRLMEEDLAVTLAVSLHAPDDMLRREIMPVARRFQMEELMEACGHFVQHTGRRVTFEYALMSGINDEPEHARQLCRLLKGMNCHVNLIPLNQVQGRMGSRPGEKEIGVFRHILEQRRIPVTVRREMGSDIDAACGQLRSRMG